MAELKTIKELAKELDCSYEAVRQHVKRYQKQLSGHISYIGKSQYLDEWACDFIKSKRIESPITIRTVERHERITELESEVKLLLQQIALVQNEMLKLKDEKHALELENAKIALLEADNEAARVKVAEAEENAQKALQELTEAHNQFEDELRRVNEAHARELEAEQRRADSARAYAAELEAWMKLPWLKRIRTPKPVEPADRLDN